MKDKKSKRGLVILLSLVTCITASVFFITCLGQQNNEGDPGNTVGPKPPQEVIIDFRSEDGKYSLDADGVSFLDFIATVTDKEGNPYVGVVVYFTTTLGTVTPTSAPTDTHGVARTKYIASCVPGSAIIEASAIGRLVRQAVNLYGDPPRIKVQSELLTIGGAGYNLFSTIQAQFWCSQNTALDNVDIGFESEYGCFDFGACPDMRVTGVNGVTSTIWFPPMYGTYEDAASDFNAPLSSPIKATYYIGEVEYPDYYDFTEIYIYPLHARLWIEDATKDADDNFLLCGSTNDGAYPYMVYVYWYDNNGFYPQPGIEVDFSADGIAITNSSGVTDSNGYTGGMITVSPGMPCTNLYTILKAGIEETGPSNCCASNSSVSTWNWASEAGIAYPPTPTPTPSTP